MIRTASQVLLTEYNTQTCDATALVRGLMTFFLRSMILIYLFLGLGSVILKWGFDIDFRMCVQSDINKQYKLKYLWQKDSKYQISFYIRLQVIPNLRNKLKLFKSERNVY